MKKKYIVCFAVYFVLIIVLSIFVIMDINKYFGDTNYRTKGIISSQKLDRGKSRKILIPFLGENHAKTINKKYIPGNIVNYGMAAEDKNYIYFADLVHNCQISRVDKFGKIKALTKNPGQCLNICDNWLFYRNWCNDKIYKMGIDGNGEKLVYNNSVNSFVVYNNVIYLVRKSDGAICSYNLTSSVMKVLGTIRNASCINIKDSWIYYINGDDDNRIYKVSLDGKKNLLIIKRSVSSNGLVNDSNKLYFIDRDKGNVIFKASIDGKQIKQLSSVGVINLNAYNGRIFYTDSFDNIYMISPGRNKANKLTNKKASFVCIIGKSIYFAPEDLKSIYICSFNGTIIKRLD